MVGRLEVAPHHARSATYNFQLESDLVRALSHVSVFFFKLPLLPLLCVRQLNLALSFDVMDRETLELICTTDTAVFSP